ncbi:MAG: NADH:ubiquinone oxidoreductase [Gemmatimonadetes bacterium]|nr:NADH:ubiquinone oxidoreductase [Gemmatimonadota bacterium]NIQ57097.1 NADH:ubiquinone oxidoreductase [Gemmatimonadota bacterium]NIU77264.1 NADH:ubiquinone oxidoreductase [Gammaproteobacteria bacterium]NIX46538.1 NADH:ubiquinone oxidoreductase [Gemmatimonadota bacterium]NIY10856.1 NADH:ubiquinone oxidoreductase [Gemmatimonadota bacterium]
MARPTAGIFGLTGCAGDQLALLNCEEELLLIVDLLDVRDFLLVSSANDAAGRLDLALVEGAVLSDRDERKLREIRARSDLLVALGTCALHGGIPIMDRDHDREALLHAVYGDLGAEYDTRSARPLHEVVPVDMGIPGCPIERQELLETLASLLHGDPPLSRDYPVCAECRMAEHGCLLERSGGLCLGPVTAAGCLARCPGLGIGCVGCRGPAVDANWPSAVALYVERGLRRDDAIRKMRTFARTPGGVTAVPRGA